MAKQIELASVKGKSKRGYDWDNWLNGEAWELVAGEDFTVDVSALRGAACAMGKTRNLQTHVRRLGNGNVAIWAEHA